jgi:hypothetical protein
MNALPFDEHRIDKWIQRLAVIALLAIAAALLAVGVAFYAPVANPKIPSRNIQTHSSVFEVR